MDIIVVKIVGVVVVSIAFVVTVLLMPRIFGVNAPSPSADQRADPVPPPAPAAAAPPVSAPAASARLAKRSAGPAPRAATAPAASAARPGDRSLERQRGQEGLRPR